MQAGDAAREMLNLGTAVLNENGLVSPSTIAATGMGRSGTTMISRTLSAIGIDMGTALTPRTNEDKPLQLAIKAGDLDAFAARCRDRDAAAPVWGFKVPALRGAMSLYEPVMRNPRFIVTFRDVLAVSLRNNIALGSDLLPALEASARGYVALVEQVARLTAPVLLVSYEKALQHPERTVSTIAAFCGRPLAAAEAAAIAADVVVNGDDRYLGG
jgi:hypothetical protein